MQGITKGKTAFDWLIVNLVRAKLKMTNRYFFFVRLAKPVEFHMMSLFFSKKGGLFQKKTTFHLPSIVLFIPVVRYN